MISKYGPALALCLSIACTPTLAPPTQVPTATVAVAGSDRWIAPAPTRTADCHAHDGLPDADCTPGATDPRVTQATITSTICRSGYSASVRPSTSVTEPIKRRELMAYGLVGTPLASVELDHLVSLELGGAPSDVANLWPEPWEGANNARIKDQLENLLHDRVCRSEMPLAVAQMMIATDWLAAARQFGIVRQ